MSVRFGLGHAHKMKRIQTELFADNDARRLCQLIDTRDKAVIPHILGIAYACAVMRYASGRDPTILEHCQGRDASFIFTYSSRLRHDLGL